VLWATGHSSKSASTEVHSWVCFVLWILIYRAHALQKGIVPFASVA
jgi:hypothetical protein